MYVFQTQVWIQAVKANHADGEMQTPPQPTSTLLILYRKQHIYSITRNSGEREERLTCWQTCQVASGTKKEGKTPRAELSLSLSLSFFFSRLTIPYFIL